MSEVKGFKVFDPDWTCRGFQYEVGKTYEEDVEPCVCKIGFHFCKEAKDCFDYRRFDPRNKVAEVVALGDVSELQDKCSTNKIMIVREITWQEVLTIVNTGRACTGLDNSGDYNTGNYNDGDGNSGNYNDGDYNTGNYNGGYRNTGNYNGGYRNTGNYNDGEYNTGYRNTGDYNTGYRNTGDYNTGDCNIGNNNTGDWNYASNVIGCFNTEDQQLRFFDKKTNMTLKQWRASNAYRLLSNIELAPTELLMPSEMSDDEKAAHPEYDTTCGYLSARDDARCRTQWWHFLSDEQREIIKNIPNFDAEKFYKITGIDVNREDKEEDGN